MGLTLAKCPACGADLNLETDRDFFYCPHCGSKVAKYDDKIVIEHVNRSIDEAEVRRIELEREMYNLEEQRIEKNRQQNLPKAKKMILVGLIVFVIGQVLSRIDNNPSAMIIWYVGAMIVMIGGATFLVSYFGDTNRKSASGDKDKK